MTAFVGTHGHEVQTDLAPHARNSIRTLNRIVNNRFLRQVTVLASGTALSQAIGVLASPALTRVYTPEDFGLFAIIAALAACGAPLVTGEYDIAMVVERSASAAEQLCIIAIWCVILTTLTLSVCLFVFRDPFVHWLGAPELAGWILLLPLLLLFTGFNRIATYIANRELRYGLISATSVGKALGIVLVSLSMGYIGVGYGGLVSGQLLGLSLATVVLGYIFRARILGTGLRWSEETWQVAKRYRDYPLFSGSTGVLDGLTLALPTLFLAKGYSESVVGYYGLMMRVSTTPLGFISASVGQVHLRKVAELLGRQQSVVPHVRLVSLLLFGFALIPAAFFVTCGPQFFAAVFGEQWREAGDYARILAPAIVVRFVSSTMSSTLGATKHVRLIGVWKVIAFVVTLAVLQTWSGVAEIDELLRLLVWTDIGLYGLYFCFIYYSAHKPKES